MNNIHELLDKMEHLYLKKQVRDTTLDFAFIYVGFLLGAIAMGILWGVCDK